jgi:isopenicillin-N epimerase
MRREWVEQFPLQPGIRMFNHASYGLAPNQLLDRAEEIRRELESDPNVNLGDQLQERLEEVAAKLSAALHLDGASCTMTTSTTAGAAALQRSLPLNTGDVVVTLDCEYSSVIRGWQRRCDEVGARLLVVDVPLPLDSADDLLERLSDAAGDRVAILLFSAITSSAAIQLPVSRLAAWGHERGAVVLVDAAHGPGQIDLGSWEGVDAAFGTVHKWIAVPRSVGLLWTTPELADSVAPAETSLTFDDPSMSRRFSWPGTFDAAPRLTVPDGLALHAEWVAAGEISRCEELADQASELLTAAGAIPTAGSELLPPRMRAFLLPRVPAPALRQRLLDADIRAWSGSYGISASLVRVATHLYNDLDDVEVIAAEVKALLS